VDEVLDRVGLTAGADRRVRGWSLGMRQRLGVGAALLRRPRLLIVDEPTNGLDPAGAADLRGLLRELASDGVTLVLSSHDMVEIAAVCDSVTIMNAGRVVFDGSLERLRREAPTPVYDLTTADDGAARRLYGLLAIAVDPGQGAGLTLRSDRRRLDSLVMALGREGIAVRSLAQVQHSLEALFFALTGGDPELRDGTTSAELVEPAASGTGHRGLRSEAAG
jgi:ABC-2 type transport system ATP-binding protein